MPNDSFYIICPYYQKTLGNSIFCDGFSADESVNAENSQFKQTFKTREERNLCISKYCSLFNYTNCRIATLNDALNHKR